MTSEKDPAEYYFNTTTGEVEHGRQSSWEHLMGPYRTVQEAEHAYEIARRRNAAWDDDDAAWRGEEG